MPLSRHQLHRVVRVSLFLLTCLVLMISLRDVTLALLSDRLLELGVYGLLTAFALVFSAPLSRGEQSIAHVIGMVAFLSLPAAVAPTMTVALFLGALVGSIGLSLFDRYPHERQGRTIDLIDMIYITSGITLSFFAASRIYILFNGTLPLTTGIDVMANLVPLLAYVTIYVVLYVVGVLLRLDDKGYILRESMVTLTIVLSLPVPFALIGASVARTDESFLFFTITIVGITLIIFGLYVLNYAQQQYRRQLDEMRSISGMSQALRDNTPLSQLLQTTYEEISKLIETSNFTVVLVDTDGSLTYPFVIREGQARAITASDGTPYDYAMMQHVLKTKQPLLISDNFVTQVRQLGLPTPNRTIKSWLGVPMIVSDQAMGALVLLSFNNRHLYNENDLHLLTIIAGNVGIAIENTRLYSQKSVRAEQLATLNQVGALLTGTLATDDVLDTIVSSASTIAGATAVAVYIQDDPKQQAMILARSAGLSNTYTAQAPQPFLRDQLAQSTDLFSQPQSLVRPSLETATETGVARSALQTEGVHALIEVPLVIGATTIGILGLYYDTPQSFDSELIDLIQAFTVQAAQAINNARTFTSTDQALEQRVEQLYALAAMGRLLNAAMDTHKIYEVVLTYAADATNAPRAVIILNHSDHLSVPVQRGYPSDTFTQPDRLQQGLVGKVLLTGQALRRGNVRQETNYVPLVPSTRSLMIVPIMKGRDVLGCVMLESDKANAFSEGDGHYVAQIANQAVIAIDNTQLFDRIREARDNMQVILNTMEEGIILIDQQAQIVLANPRVDLVGLDSGDLLNQSVYDLLDDASLKLARRLGFGSAAALERLLAQIRGHWQGCNVHPYEIILEERGTRYIQRQIIPIRDESQQVVSALLVFYNKTEEFELARSRESFSEMTVHDLRSPLTAVKTSLKLLRDLVPEGSEMRPLVEKITDTSNRALRKVLARVNSLLDISKMDSGEMYLEREPASLVHIVDQVRVQLQPLADELDITLVSDVGDLPLLDVDSDKIERMLLNLVDNALKYSPEDDTVTIRGHKLGDTHIMVEVVDNGPGVPDDYKTRLFDRFVQIEGRKVMRRGVGLGLTFSKLVAEAHDGKIWVEDNPSGGSIFKVTLPVAHLETPSNEG